MRMKQVIRQTAAALGPQRILGAIFTLFRFPENETEGKRFLRRNLFFHLRPSLVPKRTLRFSFTWGLGGMAAVLVLIQLATGVLLKFVYDPTPVAAYASIEHIMTGVPYGRLFRNLHYWCAHFLILVVWLHLMRVFFTGACHKPRQVNWIFGLVQLGVVLTANFTGYLLPWNQPAYWAVTVSTGMLAYVPIFGATLQQMSLTDGELGPATLRAFFAVHTAVAPAVLILLMGFHFWRIRKAGGLVIPKSPRERLEKPLQHVSTLPHLLLRETVTGLALIAVVLLVAVFFDAPLGKPANPGLSPNPTKAPWYFAGFQEMLLHIHPTFAICVLPLCLAAFLVLLPFLSNQDEGAGVWFLSISGRKSALFALATALVAAPGFILADTWLLPPADNIITGGLIPCIILVTALAAFYLLVKRYFRIQKRAALQSLFVFLTTCLALATVVNVWLRGQDMTLIWP
jgi:quinol-cytochrome oxidoreductase complex cytochrome b subunit